MNKSHVIKANGRKQRENIALSLEVVNAIVNEILSGKNLFSKGGIDINVLSEVGEEISIKVSSGTINSWITRENIIPETGETFRAVVNRAREQYRVEKKIETHLNTVLLAEKVLRRALLIRSNVPVRNHLGQVIKHEDGSYVRKENAALLRVKVEAAKFYLEKLEPQTYGRNNGSQKPQQSWNLAELRRYQNKLDNI